MSPAVLEQPIFVAEPDTQPQPASIPSPHESALVMPSSPTPSSSATSLTIPPSPFTSTSDSSLPSISGLQFQLPPSVSSDTQISINGAETTNIPVTTNLNQTSDVDPQILEALRSKDRLYVLKLGEIMEDLIKERRARVDLTPTTSYQRLLVHRCSAYYRLSPESDPTSKGIFIVSTVESRIPARKLCDLVPAESTTQPAFKIMRRSLQGRPSKSQSQAGSVAGEDADLSDVEPSESGSLGGRSNATGGSNKKRMTIEEREAAYNEARSRIFMGFEEKEKEKDKDMSASSSSLSLVSGSASTSGRGGSSTGDLDDSVSSPATESEWSGPSGPPQREKKDSRHPSGNASASSSSRSLRTSAPSFNTNGPGSSRNSRAPSPSFTYPTIYEPPMGPAYDPPQHAPHAGYHQTPYMYQYSPPGQPPNPYISQYPYYPYNPYQSPPPHPQQSASDPPAPASGELYSPHPHMTYGPPYGWHPPLQSPPQMQQHSSHMPPLQHHNLNAVSPPSHSPQYHQPYIPYTYPMSGYYTPQPGQQMEPPHVPPQAMYDVPRPANGNVMTNHPNNHTLGRNGTNSTSNGRPPARSSITLSHGGGKARAAPPMTQSGSAWSYGPGVGMGGYSAPVVSLGGDAIGPRLSSTRRPSSNSASSGNSRSSNCDDVSSTASSSTTSSSSRRTYTSTTSSQHPLPPRPDWAVGLKPQPTLHSTQARHHDQSLSNSRTMSPISPPRNINGASQHTVARQLPSQQHPPTTLQSTDFPPLTSVAVIPEKRTPVITGAWSNSPARSIRLPSPGHPNPSTNAPVQPPLNAGANNTPDTRLEEPDRGFERPPPKSAELFNPKVLRRPTGNKPHGEKGRTGGGAMASAILVGQVEGMTLEEPGTDNLSMATTIKEPVMT